MYIIVGVIPNLARKKNKKTPGFDPSTKKEKEEEKEGGGRGG